MSIGDIIFWIIAIFIGLPILSFIVVKFAMTGYYRAKERHENKNKH